MEPTILTGEVWTDTLADLRDLVAVPSVSRDGLESPALRTGAERVRDALERAGAEAEVVTANGSAPTVLGRVPGPAGAPTVLLYAHYDVQPAGDADKWTHPPFAPQERDGRLYGRGAADNKSGIAVHLAALRSFAGSPPVNLVVFVEGEEEVSSPHFHDLLAAYGDELEADAALIVDGQSAAVGVPGLTVSMRGLIECDVELRTLSRDVHSGLFGGVAPDAVTALVRLLAALHDPDGAVAVPGLRRSRPPDGAFDHSALAADAGLLDGVQLLGADNPQAALWSEPSITPIGIDAPSFETARNAQQAVARARLSVRLAPDDDPDRAFEAVRDMIERATPWGAHVEISCRASSRGWAGRTDGPCIAATREACTAVWGRPPVELGLGGTLPLLPPLIDAMPEMEVVLFGIQDPAAQIHAADESIDLNELQRACRAEVELLTRYAREADK